MIEKRKNQDQAAMALKPGKGKKDRSDGDRAGGDHLLRSWN